jgi:signal transduction histidine kinase
MAIVRRPVRSRPIRLFLIGMFAIPLVSLVGLWAFTASITVNSAISDHNYNVSIAAIDVGGKGLTLELPVEQQETYLWLATDRKTSEAPLLATRKLVSEAIPATKTALMAENGQLSATSRGDLNDLFSDLEHLDSTRQAVDAGTLSPAAAFQAYSTIIDNQFQYYYSAIQDKGASLADVTIGVADAAYALEMGSREATLVGGALADRGQMSPSVRQLFTSSEASRRLLMSQAVTLLTPAFRAGYISIINSPQYQQFQAIEDQISAGAGSGPILLNARAWEAASGAYLAAMEKAENASGPQLAATSASQSSGLVTEAVLAGGLGLLAVVVSVFLMAWFGRKVTRDLTGLHNSVRDMAEVRLPWVVARLRRGDDVDVAAESPPPGISTIAEISQIATSFATVQGAAVAAAVEQARLRKGINRVFLNISLRSQSLLHRQLGMLDGMERRTSEPGALADLFRLDHLTTRMRRHAEGLIILSGSTPGRGWRDPVPVIDVLRAAVAEVEDYVRVDVVSESLDLVSGNAVNDVIHLVAELVENATVFSPPNTRIEVRADRVGTGLVAEVEDRGLGLSAPELADINRRLASPPEFDLANSEQLGLFVVSTLAARHQIKVSLRQSAYGGTTAILLLPFGVVVREEEVESAVGGRSGEMLRLPPGMSRPGPEPSGQGADDQSPFGATGRHRLAAAATGRRVHTGEIPRSDDQDWPPALRTSPPSPGAYAQSQSQSPPLPPLPPAPWDVAPTSSWPHAFERDLRSQQAPLTGDPGQHGTPPASMPDTEPAAGAADTPAASHLGMPVRVPQASLAPQLRAGRDGDSQAPVREVSDVEQRAPEATRTMMMTMQQGWQRGRLDDLDDLDDAASQEN